MRKILGVITLVLVAGCASASWQVSDGGNGDALLLNTQTGETWYRFHDVGKDVANGSTYKSFWVKMGGRQTTTQP